MIPMRRWLRPFCSAIRPLSRCPVRTIGMCSGSGRFRSRGFPAPGLDQPPHTLGIIPANFFVQPRAYLVAPALCLASFHIGCCQARPSLCSCLEGRLRSAQCRLHGAALSVQPLHCCQYGDYASGDIFQSKPVEIDDDKSWHQSSGIMQLRIQW